MDEMRETLRERGKRDLYFLAKGVLGFHKMVPHLHKPAADFMARPDLRRRLGVLPRGFYKTSLWTMADSVRLLINDRNTAILIVNETQANARRFLRKIKSFFERNDVFRWLYPEVIPDFSTVKRWSADEMEIPRTEDWAEASIEVMGLGAKTSRHYPRIKFDDLVSVEAAASQTLMDKAKDEIAYAEPLLRNPAEDYIDYIGTRWGNDDVINHILEECLFEEPYFLKRAIEDGKPIFPEQYSMQRLKEIERRLGPYKFSTLYMNDPFDDALADFKEPWLKWYELDEFASAQYGEFIIRMDDNRRAIRRSELDVTMVVDPARSKLRTADRTGITVVGSTQDGRNMRFLLEAWAKHARPAEVISKLIELYRVWRPRVVGFETVAFQFMLKDEFVKQRDKHRLEISVRELKTPSNIPKEARIRGLEPDFCGSSFYVRKDQTDFLDEYRKFPTGRYKDLLDSLAYHKQLWRTEFSPERNRQFEMEEQMVLALRPAAGY
jgi:hypothetical protein